MDKEMSWTKRLFWIVVPVVFAFIGGYLLNILNAKEPNLEYEIINNVDFKGGKQSYIIYKVIARNSGKTTIENIDGLIKIDFGTVGEYNIDISPTIKKTITNNPNSIEIQIPFLNPNEEFTISILAIDDIFIPQPSFIIRGSGIVGIEKKPSLGNRFFEIIITVSIIISSISLAYVYKKIVIVKEDQKRIREKMNNIMQRQIDLGQKIIKKR